MRVVGAVLAVLLALVCALLVLWMVTVGDLALCSDPEGLKASGEDDCIEGSSGERAIGLVLGWAAVACSALAVAFGVACARGRSRGGALAVAGLATPVLAFASLWFTRISF